MQCNKQRIMFRGESEEAEDLVSRGHASPSMLRKQSTMGSNHLTTTQHDLDIEETLTHPADFFLRNGAQYRMPLNKGVAFLNTVHKAALISDVQRRHPKAESPSILPVDSFNIDGVCVNCYEKIKFTHMETHQRYCIKRHDLLFERSDEGSSEPPSERKLPTKKIEHIDQMIGKLIRALKEYQARIDKNSSFTSDREVYSDRIIEIARGIIEEK